MLSYAVQFYISFAITSFSRAYKPLSLIINYIRIRYPSCLSASGLWSDSLKFAKLPQIVFNIRETHGKMYRYHTTWSF